MYKYIVLLICFFSCVGFVLASETEAVIYTWKCSFCDYKFSCVNNDKPPPPLKCFKAGFHLWHIKSIQAVPHNKKICYD